MGVPSSQLTTNFSAKYQLTTICLANSQQLTTNFGQLLTFTFLQGILVCNSLNFLHFSTTITLSQVLQNQGINSLRSKRFRASLSRTLGREQKKDGDRDLVHQNLSANRFGTMFDVCRRLVPVLCRCRSSCTGQPFMFVRKAMRYRVDQQPYLIHLVCEGGEYEKMIKRNK